MQIVAFLSIPLEVESLECSFKLTILISYVFWINLTISNTNYIYEIELESLSIYSRYASYILYNQSDYEFIELIR